MLNVEVISNDRIASVELIHDGQVSQKAVYEPSTGMASFGSESFHCSGWFLVRVMTDVKTNFRFASTARFYVEVGPDHRRISKRAVQFLLDWIDERIDHLREGFGTSNRLPSVLAPHLEAQRVLQRQLQNANAE